MSALAMALAATGMAAAAVRALSPQRQARPPKLWMSVQNSRSTARTLVG